MNVRPFDSRFQESPNFQDWMDRLVSDRSEKNNFHLCGDLRLRVSVNAWIVYVGWDDFKTKTCVDIRVGRF